MMVSSYLLEVDVKVARDLRHVGGVGSEIIATLFDVSHRFISGFLVMCFFA